MLRTTMTCRGGPADGAVVAVAALSSYITVPAAHVPGLTGIYHVDLGLAGPRLLYTDEVRFTNDGADYACRRGGGDVASGPPVAAPKDAHWIVSVGGRDTVNGAQRVDDFATGSDFVERMVRAVAR